MNAASILAKQQRGKTLLTAVACALTLAFKPPLSPAQEGAETFQAQDIGQEDAAPALLNPTQSFGIDPSVESFGADMSAQSFGALNGKAFTKLLENPFGSQQSVIPAKAGIQNIAGDLDPGLRRSDGKDGRGTLFQQPPSQANAPKSPQEPAAADAQENFVSAERPGRQAGVTEIRDSENLAFGKVLAQRSQQIQNQVATFAASFASRSAAAAVPESAVPKSGDVSASKDVTAEFDAAKLQEFSPEEKSELRDKSVLVFVGGLFSNYEKKAKIEDKEHVPQSFEGAARFAKSLKIPYVLPRVKTEQIAKRNALELIRIIKEAAKEGKHAVFISHSHGALDVLRALEILEASPETRSLLDSVSWISIQAPFLGSRLANHVVDGPHRNIVSALLKTIGGTWHSIFEMTTEEALRHYQRHQAQIGRILERVPTLAVASYLSKPRSADSMPRGWKFLLQLGVVPQIEELYKERDLADQEIKTDGLVPLSSQYFDEMERVILEDFGHFDPVASDDADGHSRLTGLLRMILNRRAKRQSSSAAVAHSR